MTEIETMLLMFSIKDQLPGPRYSGAVGEGSSSNTWSFNPHV